MWRQEVFDRISSATPTNEEEGHFDETKTVGKK
jgi:hypothetical protein